MTIAVGFKCTDGLVLAVDSQITFGMIRHDGEKAWLLRFPADAENPTLKVGIVGSGDTAFIRYAAELIEVRLKPKMGIDQVQGAVQGVINDIHLDHLYPYPDRFDRPEVSLIVGVMAHDGDRLLITSLTAVSQVWNYEAVGIGRDLGTFIIKRFYSDSLDVAAAAFISAQVLMHARNHVVECGGESKILMMYKAGGLAGFLPDKILKQYEGYAAKFEAAIQPVMFGGVASKVTDDQFAGLLDQLSVTLKEVRKDGEVTKQEERVRETIISLSGVSAVGSVGPVTVKTDKDAESEP